MKKICDVILIILCLLLIIVLSIIGKEYINRNKNENNIKEIIKKIDKNEGGYLSTDNNEFKINGFDYEIEGILEIPKINIKYPILKDSSEEAMKVSIVKYSGGAINEYGNYSIAGHNYKDGLFFGNTKQLENGDIIKITDLSHNTIIYKVVDKFITDPNDVTILETKNNSIREITLITCTNGRKNRLIIKAHEDI